MNAPQATLRPGVGGTYAAQHWRCAPGREAEYFPIFNRYTAAIESGQQSDADAILLNELRPLQVQVGTEDVFDNIVTTVGKNLTLDTILAGSAFTATVRMGLKGTGTAVAGDTQASHAGWLEQGLANAPTYTGNRPTPSFSSASAGSKATSAAVNFAITSTGTVFGAFININGSATKDDTTGTLFSAGDFSGGSKAVINGDTISVSYSCAA